MENWERDFINTAADTLSRLPVFYPDNYEQPPANWPKKIGALSLDLPNPPRRVVAPPTSASSSTTPMKLSVKSSKPPATFTIKVASTDTIATLKQILANTTVTEPNHPIPPPAESQRLLFKGKVLADTKLVKEYSITEGDTINLMSKPGFTWETTPASTGNSSAASTKTPLTAAASASSSMPPPSMSLTVSPMEGVEKTSSSSGHIRSRSASRSHSRAGSNANIPDLTISASPTPGTNTPLGVAPPLPLPVALPLTLDTSLPPPSTVYPGTTFQATIARPMFWEHLYAFLKNEFDVREDANQAFEEFLLASKNYLTAHEIAKIRDGVGLFGMGGT